MPTNAWTPGRPPGRTTARPTARIKSPGDLAAVVPEMIGFVPKESLVVLSLHEPRGRIGLTMRFDLADAPVLHLQVPPRLRHDGATRAALIVYTSQPDDCEQLVRDLSDLIAADAMEVTETLLVRDGRWRSYTCTKACCPREGTPLPAAGTGVLALVAAERVLSGGVVLGSREELEGTLKPVDPLDRAVVDRAAAALLERVAQEPARVQVLEVAALRRALLEPATVGQLDTARCVVALHHVPIRDEVLTWVRDSAPAVRALCLLLLRRAPIDDAAPVLTVLGGAAYAEGGGTLARLALEQALRVEPGYSMAELLLHALDHQVPPQQVRRVLAPLGSLRQRRSAVRAAARSGTRSGGRSGTQGRR